MNKPTTTKKGRRKTVKAWMVVNTELNVPCVFYDSMEDVMNGKQKGAAIFEEEWTLPSHAREEARAYKKELEKHNRMPTVKIVRCKIIYTLPSKRK